jgi:hypothetical protein
MISCCEAIVTSRETEVPVEVVEGLQYLGKSSQAKKAVGNRPQHDCPSQSRALHS